jgi:hypothetical protein
VVKVTNQEKEEKMTSTEKVGTESLTTKIASLKGIPTQEELTNLLSESTLVVTFNKLDGDERVMTCTKDTKLIPEESLPKTNKPPKAQGLVTVWDVNAKGWRSFKYDRVTKVEMQ